MKSLVDRVLVFLNLVSDTTVDLDMIERESSKGMRRRHNETDAQLRERWGRKR